MHSASRGTRCTQWSASRSITLGVFPHARREASARHGNSNATPADAKYKPKQNQNQKWVQCFKCQKWRQVPYTLTDDQLTDEWECKSNVWDPQRSSCEAPQALSDKAIDEILALQVRTQHSKRLAGMWSGVAQAAFEDVPCVVLRMRW